MPGENRHLFDGILPYDNIEGAEVQILGRFLEFIDRLFEWAEILERPKKLHEWQTALLALLEHFFRPDENTETGQLQFLRNMLAGLSDRETLAGFNHDIGPAVIGCYLKSLLEQKNYGANFLTGGITFCAMLPMRSIPFKVICMIGMNNDVFRENISRSTLILSPNIQRPETDPVETMTNTFSSNQLSPLAINCISATSDKTSRTTPVSRLPCLSVSCWIASKIVLKRPVTMFLSGS